MKNIKQSRLKSEEGFTIIELTIVIAIMGILSAILIPSFTTMSRKAKIKADINTIRSIQAQIELYEIEYDELPGEAEDYKELINDGKLSETAVEALLEGKYIRKSDTLDSAGKQIRLQSKDGDLAYNTENKHFQLKLEDDKDLEYVEKMSESDKAWIEGASQIAGAGGE